MKKAVRILSVVMALAICLSCFVGCSSSSSSESKTKIKTSSEAISEVKGYAYGTDWSLNNQIARKYGFKSFSAPNYGTCTATQKADGSWEVSIKGNMIGYTDDYNSNLEKYNFDVYATVTEEGNVKLRIY